MLSVCVQSFPAYEPGAAAFITLFMLSFSPSGSSNAFLTFRLQGTRIFYFDGEHGTSSYLTGKQEVVPYELAAIFLPSSILWKEYPEILAFRVIQFLEMMTFQKGISRGVAGGQYSTVSRRWWINSNASLECDARLWGPVCDFDNFDNFAVPYVSKEGVDASVKRCWKKLGKIFDASGRNADMQEQTIAVPTSAVDQLRVPTVWSMMLLEILPCLIRSVRSFWWQYNLHVMSTPLR